MFFHPFFDFDGSGYGPHAGSYYQRGEDVNNSRLYEVLGVPRNATDAQIRKAYLVKAKQMHPDKGGQSGRGSFLPFDRTVVPKPVYCL